MLTSDQLLRRIDAFLKKTGMRATTLGREAIGDTAFVSRLRTGKREARSATQEKLLGFMKSYQEAQQCQKPKAAPKRSTRKT